jgi:hypothetical protein
MKQHRKDSEILHGVPTKIKNKLIVASVVEPPSGPLEEPKW